MRHYNSPSMKPTMIITNHSAFGSFDLGAVKKSKKRKSKQTTRRYVDGSGKKRFTGTKSLKKSQKLICSIQKGFALSFAIFADSPKCFIFQSHNDPNNNFQEKIILWVLFCSTQRTNRGSTHPSLPANLFDCCQP